MKRLLIPASLLALALTCAVANAAPNPAIYMVNGKIVTPQQALQAALHDTQVMACKPVVATLSKGGNSIRLALKKAR